MRFAPIPQTLPAERDQCTPSTGSGAPWMPRPLVSGTLVVMLSSDSPRITRTGPTQLHLAEVLVGRPRRIASRLRHHGTASTPSAERVPHRELVRRDLADYANRIDLDGLVRRHGSPLLVLDTDRVTTQLLALRHELPDVAIHFATGALPHLAAITAIDAFGASFSVASRCEIDLLERAGVSIARCLHNHPMTSVADITGAYLRGIRTFVVDSESEVAKFRGLPEVAVLVRLAFPTRGDRSPSFGVRPGDAPALVAHCLQVGLRVAGFTFDVGSQTVSVAPWQRAIRRTLALIRDLEERHAIRFEMLDLGGGLPVAYDEPVPTLAELAHGIRGELADAPRHLKIAIEPGRFVAAPAATLVTRVVGTADRPDGRWHYLDEGVHGAFSGSGAEGAHPLVFAASELAAQPTTDGPADAPTDAPTERATRRRRARRDVPVTLAGPTCDSADVIARGMALPALADGDLLVSPMMGAYTAATSCNGLTPTPFVVVPG
ncbi:type III PLP-dependent enzyme [Agromyces humatus]|uniref:Type III PLP-dependent enzyme n=1 Tax=Agromyces humatus TaxID=279573 RepID=A0ABP4X1F2_9MICO|nr:type III PLP-dependent enzyme [Agromyces humatus]